MKYALAITLAILCLTGCQVPENESAGEPEMKVTATPIQILGSDLTALSDRVTSLEERNTKADKADRIEAEKLKKLLAEMKADREKSERESAARAEKYKASLAEMEKKWPAEEKPEAKPIDPPTPPKAAASKPRPYKNNALSDAILKARDEGKEVVIVFRQTVCVPCDKFESRVLKSRYYVNESKSAFETVTVNIDEWPALAAAFTVMRTPLVAIYCPNGSNDEATIRKRFVPSADPYLFLSEISN